MSAVPASLVPSPGAPIGRVVRASSHDLDFARKVLGGLAAKPKSIRIDELDGGLAFGSAEAGRMEELILRHCARQIVAAADRSAGVIEVGDARSPSTALLRVAMDQRSTDIAGACKRIVVVPPGRMGRLGPIEGARFLRELGERCGADAWLVAGAALPSPGAPRPQPEADSAHDEECVHRLFDRINEELAGDFDLGEFRHDVGLDEARQCVEVRMLSRKAQAVRVLGRTFRFSVGEPIRLATAHRYSLARFEHLVAGARWQHCQLWCDGQARYAVHVLERSCRSGRLGSQPDGGEPHASDRNVSIR